MTESPVAEQRHLAAIEQGRQAKGKKPQRGGRRPLSCLALPPAQAEMRSRAALRQLHPLPSGGPLPPESGASGASPIGSGTAVDVDLASPEAAGNALDAAAGGSATAAAAGTGLVARRNSHSIPGFAEPVDVFFFLRTVGLDVDSTAIPVSSLTQLLAEIQRANQPSAPRSGAATTSFGTPGTATSSTLCSWPSSSPSSPSAPSTSLPGRSRYSGVRGSRSADLAHVWHRASHQALMAGDFESRPCIVQLQTFSITQFYWYATNEIDALNSRLGQAVRTAQNLGLDKDKSPSQTLHDEMRHRIWWDLVDSDTFQSICLDRPPLIRVESPGVPLPLNCNDGDITDAFLRPRPHDEPTVMMANIFRAQFFKLMNRHICFGSPDDAHSYDAIRKLDDAILGITATYPWFYQLDRQGRPPPLPEPLGEILSWKNHIIRTSISTQRIRMYRPFLSSRVGDSWAKCIEAAEDAMAVYRTIRANRSIASLQKSLPQAYQIFSIAVTVTALLLVEGSLPISNVRQQIRDMAEDLWILEDQGCVSPVASRGRQVLLKMLSLVDMGNNGASASEEDTDGLPSEIGFIFGGEQAARTYMQRLASRNQRLQGRNSSAGVCQMDLMMDDMVLQNLLNSDMAALMADKQGFL
ncbi:transcription factor [Trichoderma cornu-damae]|uniref:Transcription factor n=1 Tax=Trichoderma cornu-damae TaxID=654480 RepID=A0A9P8QWW4_9HYPO|nr:transcription factor [Trichoderma cornu-damae]